MMTDNLGRDDLPVHLVANAPGLTAGQVDSGFDYNGLASNTASALFERRAAIRAAIVKTTEVMIAIGSDLIAAKEMLGRGRFVDWVVTECGLRIRTAQNYMAIARVSTKHAFVAHLPVGMVLRIARADGRRELLEKISASIGAGRAPTEEEFCILHTEFKRMRARRPKRSRGRSGRTTLKPVEKRLPLYRGYTKAEYVKLNFAGLVRFGGYNNLSIFADIVESETVAETMQLVEAELRRVQFEMKLSYQAWLSNPEEAE
jgi:hypothetical protein